MFFITKNELKTIREKVLKKSLRDIERITKGKMKASTISSYENAARRVPLEKVLELLKIYFDIYHRMLLEYAASIPQETLPSDHIEFENSENKKKQLAIVLKQTTTFLKICANIVERVGKYSQNVMDDFKDFLESTMMAMNHYKTSMNITDEASNVKKPKKGGVKTNGKRSGSKKKKR